MQQVRNEETDLATVQTIGLYRVEGRSIGCGAFSKVYKGRHIMNQEVVAMKFIYRNSGHDVEEQVVARLKRVQREKNVLSLLNHPHIIKLFHEFNPSSNLRVFSMEFAGGGELFDYIYEKGQLGEVESRRLFRQLSSAVCYLHSHFIVHRDLKPENVLLTKDKKSLKVIDFGFSQLFDPASFRRSSCGSSFYMAPEIVNGEAYIGPEVDVWSVGVMLFSMVCGRVPFDEATLPRLYQKISGGIYSIPSNFSLELVDLLKGLIKVDRMKRMNITAACHHEWAMDSGRPVNSYVPKRAYPPQRVDTEVTMSVIKTFGLDKATAIHSITNGVENLCTAVYFLHTERMIRMRQGDHRDTAILEKQQQYRQRSWVRNRKPSDVETADWLSRQGSPMGMTERHGRRLDHMLEGMGNRAALDDLEEVRNRYTARSNTRRQTHNNNNLMMSNSDRRATGPSHNQTMLPGEGDRRATPTCHNHAVFTRDRRVTGTNQIHVTGTSLFPTDGDGNHFRDESGSSVMNHITAEIQSRESREARDLKMRLMQINIEAQNVGAPGVGPSVGPGTEYFGVDSGRQMVMTRPNRDWPECECDTGEGDAGVEFPDLGRSRRANAGARDRSSGFREADHQAMAMAMATFGDTHGLDDMITTRFMTQSDKKALAVGLHSMQTNQHHVDSQLGTEGWDTNQETD